MKVKFKKDKAQSLVEMTMIIGIVTSVLVAMSPMVKRALQGMIKTVADEIGNQEESEQDFGAGYLSSSKISTREHNRKVTMEDAGELGYDYSHITLTNTESEYFLGVTKVR